MTIVAKYLDQIQWEVVVGTCLRILLILIIAWIAAGIIKRLLSRVEERLIRRGETAGEPPSESSKRVETLIRLVRQGIYLTLWVAVGLVIVKELGVDIGPILAGAGIAGLAVGFGAQNLVRDVISGFFFILENQVRVGDVAVVNGTGGLVEQLNFRTIVLRDISGVVHVFPNGTVDTLSNMTNGWSAYVFEIGVAYKEDTDRVVAVLQEVGNELQQSEDFGPLILEPMEIMGVDKFGASEVVIKGRIKTMPIRQWMVGREFLRRVKYAFDAQGIEIPFPHRTLYFGDASRPFDLRMHEAAPERKKGEG